MPDERVLIVLSGGRLLRNDVPLWMAGADHVVAADGGANVFSELGLSPHTVLGDFDSILPGLQSTFIDAEVIHYPDQETTDFQKALAYALDRLGASNIVVLGSEGDRLDHTLSALGAAAGTSQRARIRFVFETSIVHLVAGMAMLRVRPWLRVSLIPLSPSEILYESGLKYPTEGLRFAAGVRDGISNTAEGDTVELHVAEGGCLAVFIERFEGDVEW